jgi:hypothetical protein
MVGSMVDSPKDIVQASNFLNIQFTPDVWRLVSAELEPPTTLVEASPEGLIVHPVFVQARQLPGATLSPTQVMRVVLGWAPESRAWRLGVLLLSPNMTKVDTAQMQWCELAEWPDDIFGGRVNGARVAGQTLARLLNRPFQFVDPNTQPRVAAFINSDQPEISMSAEPVPPPPSLSPRPATQTQTFAPIYTPSEDGPDESAPLPAIADIETFPTEPSTKGKPPEMQYPEIVLASLPLKFPNWKLALTPIGVRWQRLQGWWLVNIGRVLLFGALCVLFLILGIGARTSGLADVEPAWLPAIGLLVGILMLGSLLHTLWRMFSASTVVVDTFNKEVHNKGLVLPFINWRVPFSQIEYVLVSQSAPQSHGRRQKSDPMKISEDVWIHIFDGQTFHLIAEIEGVEGRSWVWDMVKQHMQNPVRRPLELPEYDTPAHHAALQIANRIGVPVYVEFA